SYRQAMMASNGGEVAAYDDVWNLHPILDKSDRKRLSRSCNDILRETRIMRDWPDWPENAVAVADNGTGDKLPFLREGPLYQPGSSLRMASRVGRFGRGRSELLGASARSVGRAGPERELAGRGRPMDPAVVVQCVLGLPQWVTKRR